MPNDYDVTTYLDNTKLVPRDTYDYNMMHKAYTYDIVKNDIIKVLLN